MRTKMNILRKALLRMARGVAQEEAIGRQMMQAQHVNTPVEKIRISQVIPGREVQYRPCNDIIDYIEKEMAKEIGEKMAETGLIRFDVNMPRVFINPLGEFDAWENGNLTITAEALVARKAIAEVTLRRE